MDCWENVSRNVLAARSSEGFGSLANPSENAEQKIGRDELYVVVQDRCHPGSRCACALRNLGVSDLLPPCGVFQPFYEDMLNLHRRLVIIVFRLKAWFALERQC